jgi:hypothetical protein
METLTKASAETVAPFMLPNGYLCFKFHRHPSGKGVVLAVYPNVKYGKTEFASWAFYNDDLKGTSDGDYHFNDLDLALANYWERVRRVGPLEQARWEIENDLIKRKQWARLLGAEA